ncbi:MAG: amidohydrolase, partial [Bacteroidia bacterium]|nr:amidohydrolase [Bacteroidia bacterium]
MKSLIIMLFLVASVANQSCQRVENADFIVKNSVVYSVDSNFRIAESFAVRDGKFLAIGTNQEIEKRYRSDKVYDLGGKPVYPGFYDAHCHFNGYAGNLRKA